jgi:hypothetical protein
MRALALTLRSSQAIKTSAVSRVPRRFLAAESKVPATTADATKKVEIAVPKVVEKTQAPGSTFFQRLSSFLAGCGVGFGLTYYFLLTELEESNEKFSRELSGIQSTINQIKGK